MDKNEELFKGTTFSDLMSDVYHNSKKKDRQINQLIQQLQPLIKSAADATVIVQFLNLLFHIQQELNLIWNLSLENTFEYSLLNFS